MVRLYLNRGMFSSDFIAAMAIFIVAMIIISPLWGSINRQTENQETTRAMQSAALTATDILLRTGGYPENWNTTNVRSIGLAQEERIINATKAKYLFQLFITNYTDVKYMLGAGAFQMGTEISDKNGLPIIFEGVNFTNSSLTEGALEITNIQRIAIIKYNETSREFVNLKVILWR